jgi:N-acetylglutamate synthase-like GNAT family acetyltransferase
MRKIVHIREIVDRSSFSREVRELVVRCGLNSEYLDDAEVWLGAFNLLEELIGFVAIERRNARIHLQSLCVHPDNRKNGIGSALVNHVFLEHACPGETLVVLTLFWNNRFYYKLGFQRLNAREAKKADDIGSRKKHKHCTALGKTKGSS